MFLIIVVLVGTAAADLGLGGGGRDRFVEMDDVDLNGTLYSISNFSPKTFTKTEEFQLNYHSCLQFSYKLSQKRVKLNAYTCQMSEGGYCILDKFVFPKKREGCAYLRPWSYKEDSFTFYFMLERRVRQFRKDRRRRRISKRQLDPKPVGQLSIDGIMPCDEVCDGLIVKQKQKASNKVF